MILDMGHENQVMQSLRFLIIGHGTDSPESSIAGHGFQSLNGMIIGHHTVTCNTRVSVTSVFDIMHGVSQTVTADLILNAPSNEIVFV